jgi:hypothetical protein
MNFLGSVLQLALAHFWSLSVVVRTGIMASVPEAVREAEALEARAEFAGLNSRLRH